MLNLKFEMLNIGPGMLNIGPGMLKVGFEQGEQLSVKLSKHSEN